MYCLVKLLCLPDGCGDPKLEGVEFFNSFEHAKKRSDELIEVFFDEYGELDREEATLKNPKAVAYNGEVTWFGFIKEIEDIEKLKSLLT